jgi:hypothetical protein
VTRPPTHYGGSGELAIAYQVHGSGNVTSWSTAVVSGLATVERRADLLFDAADDATALLAALEGALVLSRANQSTQPLDMVQRFFSTSLPQAAAHPAA